MAGTTIARPGATSAVDFRREGRSKVQFCASSKKNIAIQLFFLKLVPGIASWGQESAATPLIRRPEAIQLELQSPARLAAPLLLN